MEVFVGGVGGVAVWDGGVGFGAECRRGPFGRGRAGALVLGLWPPRGGV